MPDYYSRYGEDRWIVDHLKLPACGYFVEVGALDGVLDSTTLYFEQKGWQGVVVEPDPRSHAALMANRKCRIDPRAAANNIGTDYFRLHKSPSWSSFTRPVDQDVRIVPVECSTLTRILIDAAAPSSIDILSIDTEGTELEVWASLDRNQFRPRIVIVEYNTYPIRCDPAGVAKAFSDSGYVLRHTTETNHILELE